MSYVTLEEANLYVSTHFASTEALRQAWEAMDEADQAVYLQKAFDLINLMPFRGKKTSVSQEGAFPRWPDTEVPGVVKAAQVETAVALTDDTATEDAAFYNKMWQYGVESYRIGNLSESSSNGSWGHGAQTQSLPSTKASSLLSPYLRGGFKIG